ncbi:MAG: TldD/PmbA family protein [bacterium]|nr:TldD/PmbA family protein [bacterium]
MTRRDFVKAGAKGMALAAVPLIFKVDPLRAFTTPPGEKAQLTDYYTHFGVDESKIKEVMAAALSRGGDYCDLYFQHSLGSVIVLEDNIVSRASTSVDFGVGIRVVEGQQTGYSFTEEITPEAMKKAARTAANIAGESGNQPPLALSYHETPNYYPIETPWEEVGIDQKIPLLQKINDQVVAMDSRVVKSQVYFLDGSKHILVANSEGRAVCDYQPSARIIARCTAEQNGRKERGGFDLAGRRGIEFFTPRNIDRLASETVRRTVSLFEAAMPEGGEMEVVLAAGSSGILLHEAIGHGMEADFNRKGTSIFADKIGKKVAEPFVSIVDSGTDENIRGSINVDDECNDSQVTHLVQDGVLTTYLHDRMSAQHYGVAPTGNGRRQSFRYPPLPRMRNTYMLPGPHTKDETIASVKKGIYCESFSNGQVDIGAGDFTFYVKSGNLIEDGKLTRPVKDVNLIGNGPDCLTKVVMVADDFELAEGGWTCGKGGQSVPVSLGLPTIKVSSITVGGVAK